MPPGLSRRSRRPWLLRCPVQPRLSFDLYSASAFQPSADARLVMLVMAVESMLDLQPRPEEVVAAGLAAVAANRPGRQGLLRRLWGTVLTWT
jgi:hypothetical protein